MKNLRTKLTSERGQALLLFVAVFTFIIVAGAIAVDFSLWFSERRGAQTDADLPSLAGAQEYLFCLTAGDCSAADDAEAESAAQTWVGDNDEAGNASLPTPIQAQNPCVKVWIEHETKALFTSIFGLGPQNIGASARACAGAITSVDGGDGEGVVPIAMNTSNDPCFPNGQPLFGAYCLIESGTGNCGSNSNQAGGIASHNPNHNPPGQFTDTPTPTFTHTPTPPNTPTPDGPTPTSTPFPVPTNEPPCNPHGIIDLDLGSTECSNSGGSGDIAELIENGANGTCMVNTGSECDPDNNGPWYDCVAVQTGNTANVLEGFRNRLENQGPCDTNDDGYESFDETIQLISGSGATGLYEARECSDGSISSRIITIIVLDENPVAGNDGYPIRAFAALYVLGCWDGAGDPPTSSTAHTEFDQECSNQGHQDVYGVFLNLTFSNSDIATPPPGGTPPPPAGTLFGVALVE